jgi:hypothetical protein
LEKRIYHGVWDVSLREEPHLYVSLAAVYWAHSSASIVFEVTPRHGPHGKQSSSVKNTTLLAHYLAMDICEPYRKRLLQHWVYCCVYVFRALPKNKSPYHISRYLSYKS